MLVDFEWERLSFVPIWTAFHEWGQLAVFVDFFSCRGCQVELFSTHCHCYGLFIWWFLEGILLKSSYRFDFWFLGSVRILGVMRPLEFVCLGILWILATLQQVKSHGNHPFSNIAIYKTTFALNDQANVKAAPSVLGLKASFNPICFVLISWRFASLHVFLLNATFYWECCRGKIQNG